MGLKLSLTTGTGNETMVTVVNAPDTTVGEVAEQVFRSDPARRGMPVPADPTLVVTALSMGPDTAARAVASDTDLASSGIRSGDHIEIVPSANAARADASEAAATVKIVEGADAGATFSLRVGSHVIGRDADVSVRLTDPLASKRHARIIVGDSIEVVDMGSTNGVMLDDAFVTRATLVQSDRIIIGDTALEISRIAAVQRTVPTAATVPFTRSPRVVPPLPEDEFELPAPPTKPQQRPFPRMALIAPVILGSTMFWITGNPTSLIFVAMSPLMMIGGYVDNRFNQGKQLKVKGEEFAGAVELAEGELIRAQAIEREARLAHFPSLEEVQEAIRACQSPMWTRRPEHQEFLEVRLGLGTVPSSLKLTMPSLTDAVEDMWERVTSLKDRFTTISDVPVTVNLRTSGGLGIAGPGGSSGAVARAALIQIVGLHSPMECVVAGFVPSAEAGDWRWLEWLPHTSSPLSPLAGDHVVSTRAGSQRLLTALEELVAQRAGKDIGNLVPGPRGAEKADRGDDEVPVTPSVVVVVQDGTPADRRRLVRLAEKGPDVNVHVLWIAQELSSLPAACRSYVEAQSSGPGTVGHVRRGGSDRPVAFETLSVADASEVARRMSCVEDAGVVVDDTADVPSSVSYVELHGFEALEPGHHEQRWRRDSAQAPGAKRPFALRALVGHAGDEPFYLDLKSQGPHALVGGTTGAGKSEFLQSWILGMAAAYSPDRVTFLYVDYKGGSAFADCVQLPHSVGLVTDLTPHLVDRALTSLRAELHYRERLLAAKGAKDLETLDKSGDPETPPSLVIVIDEFAALAQEVPDFVDGVVDIAQRGRSLGLHLIMATQRPAGVIKDNLRANTNLRIALRMADEADSSDILGVPTAAHVDPGLPGRGIARTGPGRLATFQSAYAGAHTIQGGSRASIAIRELALGAGAAWEVPDEGRSTAVDGEPDAARVVAALVGAAKLLGSKPPRRPWLDELPVSIDLAELARRAGGSSGAAFGLVDNPARQAQFVATFDPDQDGNLVVLGGSGAGKSTALRSIAVGATLSRELAPVHLYGLDAASGGLDMLRPLPHMSDVVDVDDLERVGRMMKRLVDTVRERSAEFTAARASSLTEYRASAGDRGLPRILLLVDGYGNFQSDYMNEVGRQQVFADFQEVLAEGRAVGVHVALSADRVGALHTSIQALVPRTVVLRLNDENQYGMLGLRKTGLTPQSPAGRGVDVATRLEMQIGVLGGAARIDEQARAIEQLAAKIPDRPEWHAEPIPRMPALVKASVLPPLVNGLPVLGIDGITLEPRGFDLDRPIMIAGQAGTGRTSAMAWLATSISRAYPKRRIVHLTQRRTSIGDLNAWSASFAGASAGEAFLAEWAAELEKSAEGDDQVILCIENVQDFGASMSDGPLVQAIKQARRMGHLIIGEADIQGWITGQLVSELKGARRGLLLAPEGADAQMLFSAAAPRISRADMPPGRGVWIESGRVAMVQIPWVDGDFSPDSDGSLATAAHSR